MTSLASLMKEFFTVLRYGNLFMCFVFYCGCGSDAWVCIGSKPPGAGSSGGADSGSLKVLHSLMCLSCHNSGAFDVEVLGVSVIVLVVPEGRRDCAQSETHLFGGEKRCLTV